jgi:hypothetical protein
LDVIAVGFITANRNPTPIKRRSLIIRNIESLLSITRTIKRRMTTGKKEMRVTIENNWKDEGTNVNYWKSEGDKSK